MTVLSREEQLWLESIDKYYFPESRTKKFLQATWMATKITLYVLIVPIVLLVLWFLSGKPIPLTS